MNYEGGQMSQVSEQNDEIDLKELFAAIWHNWWIAFSLAKAELPPKIRNSSIETIRAILAKSKISEPLLVVT